MPIDVNFVDELVYITSPTETVTVQELVNAIRDAEDDPVNMVYDKVIDAVGKADLGGGVKTGITMSLNSSWQIQFWSGVGMGYIIGGNLIGGVGGEPIKPTGGSDTVKLLGAEASTIVEGALSSQEHNWLQQVYDKGGGKWHLVDNQLIVYKEDNTTELMRFNLYDKDGNPSMENIYKRERV